MRYLAAALAFIVIQLALFKKKPKAVTFFYCISLLKEECYTIRQEYFWMSAKDSDFEIAITPKSERPQR
ncbi:hypothetical protein X765_05695 [Mesorhizobium sp. LSHC440B00]|nr:hypothetical protein X766_20645 [Mesorhizobium sp. LSJC255A00]ESX32909.1 hypothetical protein X765_05695 [Mesorhizobium sp. LSHC440B00]ESX40023.1 hypothetical protein X763_02735 [Mesorhizobium sp. LSHC432A00]ESX44910.1 hypothetical protein X764_01730 [Mesorhizobium sp. LSHC440A00]ESX79965.1 hypothetical protein X757_02575 [Mesorhizobium sp. LSHC414A00]